MEGQTLKTSLESKEESCEESCKESQTCKGWIYNIDSQECVLYKSIKQVYSGAVSGRICPGRRLQTT